MRCRGAAGCRGALSHRVPPVQAQGRHQETAAEPGATVLQGLAVLGGIYLLFLVELLLGTLRRSRGATVRAAGAREGTGLPPGPALHPTPRSSPGTLPRRDPRCGHGGPGTFARRWDPPLAPRSARGPWPQHPPHVRATAGAELRQLTAPEPEPEFKPHGHPHGPVLPPSPGATDVVWMVVLGDGIHNLTDGLAIGEGHGETEGRGVHGDRGTWVQGGT